MTTLSTDTAQYDWILVGGGSAGCVLANRLSADPDVRVLLLEAGPATPPDEALSPPAWLGLAGSAADWGTQMSLGSFVDRTGPWERGLGLGGSSLINAMGFLRGYRTSFAPWAAAAPGWDFDALLPYYRRSEHSMGRSGPGRGHEGPMTVRPAVPAPPVPLALADGAAQVGLPVPQDVSGGESLGIGLVDLAIVDGRRLTDAEAYLTPVTARPNLTVRTGTRVDRLVIRDGRCVGVELADGSTISTTAGDNGFARPGEVVVCAGCVGSPQLLLLSGIGPKDDLDALGIDVVVDAPGVGRNFQDHPMAGIVWAAREALPADPFQHSEALGLVRSSVAPTSRPDLQVLALDVPYVPPTVTPPAAAYSINVALMAPRSRGTVRLATADPKDQPQVDADYLADELDRRTMVEGMRIARTIGAAPAFDALRGDEFLPGAEVTDDADLLEHVRTTLGPYSHGVGTCAMGSGPDAVVDESLAVRGIRGLRVVDASVIPTIVSANIHATVLAVAERASDILRDL